MHTTVPTLQVHLKLFIRKRACYFFYYSSSLTPYDYHMILDRMQDKTKQNVTPAKSSIMGRFSVVSDWLFYMTKLMISCHVSMILCDPIL